MLLQSFYRSSAGIFQSFYRASIELLKSFYRAPAGLLQSFYRASIALLQSFYRPYTELARDLVLLTPRTQDLLASADQGPPAYSWAPGPPS